MRYLLFLFCLSLFNNNAFASENSWSIYTISGKGTEEHKTSTCLSKAYFEKSIAPLDAEMSWAAKEKPTLNTKIRKVGTLSNFEIFDIIQKYKKTNLIKVLAFKAKDGRLCPFYAWQPINVYNTDMNLSSSIQKVSLSTSVVGHSLSLNPNYYEYFSFYQNKPVRLNFDKLANKLISSWAQKLSIRFSKLDIKSMKLTVELRKPDDPWNFPTGGNYDIYFQLKDGTLKILKYKLSNSKHSSSRHKAKDIAALFPS